MSLIRNTITLVKNFKIKLDYLYSEEFSLYVYKSIRKFFENHGVEIPYNNPELITHRASILKTPLTFVLNSLLSSMAILLMFGISTLIFYCPSNVEFFKCYLWVCLIYWIPMITLISIPMFSEVIKSPTEDEIRLFLN